MDLWAIVLTGAVGLAAGQVGAWLQGRRDASTDQRRQSAEIERLRLQLADSREQQATERAQSDLLEWRERRLNTYQVASAAYQTISKNTFGLLRKTDPIEVATAITRIRQAADALEDHLDNCALLSTNTTRDKASRLIDSMDSLLFSLERYERRMVEIVSASEDGQTVFAAIVESRWLRGTREPEMYRDTRKFADAFENVDDKFAQAAEAWRGAVRVELGVPD